MFVLILNCRLQADKDGKKSCQRSRFVLIAVFIATTALEACEIRGPHLAIVINDMSKNDKFVLNLLEVVFLRIYYVCG